MTGIDDLNREIQALRERISALSAASLTEPLSRHRAVFSPRYREKIRAERRESAWFRGMLALEEDPERYRWLDVNQLVKHAFGLAHIGRRLPRRL